MSQIRAEKLKKRFEFKLLGKMSITCEILAENETKDT
jgi:hypothetical protein